MSIRTLYKNERPDNPEHKQEFLRALSDSLPPFIARAQVGILLGGLITPKTLANADAKGTDPQTSWAVGAKVVYSREALVAWLGDNFPIQKIQSR